MENSVLEKMELYDVRTKERAYIGYVKKDGREFKVEVYHSKGGMNYFSGQSSQAGFYGLVTPIKERGNGIESFTLLGEDSGRKYLIEPAKRYSAKRLAELAKADIGTSRMKPLLNFFGLPMVAFPA